MVIHKLTIGTRGSRLALKQTDLAVQALKSQNPLLEINIKTIVTKGDKNQSPIPLDTIGKAWFTEEIEQALLSGEIDLAVHSLKDLPPEVPKGLLTAAILERDDPRDVLVAKSATSLAQLPKDAIIGTDSIRRKAELLRYRPDLVVKSVRGNVDTRLNKLQVENYDALIIAAAGLSRLDLLQVVTEFLDPSDFVPAVGQGVIAVEACQDQPDLWRLIKKIQDEPTLVAVAAEQMFSQVIGGGCKLPVGCYARLEAGMVFIHGMLGSIDALTIVTRSVSGPEARAISLAEQLAKDLLKDFIVADQ